MDSLTSGLEPYSVTGSLEDGGFSTTAITGDHTSSAFSDAAGDAMGKQDFLTLLTTQLKYQDPLEPQDNGEFVAQLAQFSQLEASSNQTESMESLKNSFESSLNIQNNSAMSMTNSTAVTLIGKEVRLRQQTFDWLGSGEAEFDISLGEHRSVTASVLDENGEIVKEFTIDQKDATNAGKFKWDGTNVNGMPVDPGEYTLHVNGQEDDPSLYCFVEDTVDGVRYGASGPVVKVSGNELPIGNILEVNTVVAKSSTSGALDMTMGQALSLVGKDVKYSDNGTTFATQAEGVREYNIDFAGSSTARVVVRDSEGNIAFQYDVRDEDGNGVETLDIPMGDINGTGGKYSVSIEKNSNAFFYKEGPISGVVPSGYGIKLKVDGMEISSKDILEVST